MSMRMKHGSQYGAPRKPESELKRFRAQVALTEAEATRVGELASAGEVTISQWLRDLVRKELKL